MPESVNQKPNVRISSDELEAFLQVPTPEDDKNYTIEDLKEILEQNGVHFGILETALQDMAESQLYNQPILVAKGIKPVDGVDGYYEYMFQPATDKKPQIKPNGSVDYWSVNNIQPVEAGQVIAIYHPPIQGKDGTGVKGNVIFAKRGKDQPLLKGKGFERSADDLTYTASIDGKIEMQGDRIVILAIHEISGDADITGGNIDFCGDVVVHGNVENGITIKASGSITIDGTVEACTLIAGKDIILRVGMLGGNRSMVKTKGSIYAKFFENTIIEADGIIQADVLMNCTVDCKSRIILKGNRASIIGGEIHAIQGVETFCIGNDAETKTYIYAGVEEGMQARATQLEKKISSTKAEITKIELGLEQFRMLEEEKGVSYSNDPRRMALLRIRIRDVANLAEEEAEYKRLQELLRRGRGASVKVLSTIYPGVQINIDGERIKVQNEASNVEFYHLENVIRTRPAS